MVKSILQHLLVLHSPNLHQLFILTWSTDTTWWFVFVLDLHFTLGWQWLGRNDYVYFTVAIGVKFTKLAPTVHLDMIYWCQMVVCVLDLHFTPEWPWLGRNDYVYITVPMSAIFTKLAPTVHLDTIYWCHMVFCVLDLNSTLEWQWLGRNG